MNTYEITLKDETDSITIIQRASTKLAALAEIYETFNPDEKGTIVEIVVIND